MKHIKVMVTAAKRNPNWKNQPLETWRTTLDFDNSSRFRFGHKKNPVHQLTLSEFITEANRFRCIKLKIPV
ncbi:hypothetical protein TorRG33x02_314490 [Trema orientale]|uniref:Uncharacterized protein n=1 Tax=Trema orientale TaxID=63057 RepID=A0A2P5BNM5_TREOI|nr:hypothetical protein TorRG33x02_314490 [Trema orientale]